jgi:S-adenosylmethionine hydrolase
LPDNGVITPVIERDGLQSAPEIINRSWMISDAISCTFHGRDIFSPAAAHLAAGWDFNQAGPEANELVRLKPKTSVMNEQGIEGDVIGLDDPYGSLVTDVASDDFKKLGYNLGDQVTAQIAGKSIVVPYEKLLWASRWGNHCCISTRGAEWVSLLIREITPQNSILCPR